MYFDRYNYALKNHMYIHNEAFKKVGKPVNKFAYFGESAAFLPRVFEAFLKNKDFMQSEFKYVFTREVAHLNAMSNARLLLMGDFTYGRAFPYGEEPRPEFISPENYKHKTKNISIIASNKRMCRLHILRQEFARKCKRENLADTYGRFDGGEFCQIEEPFQHYRYSIAIENNISPFYFTEKITNCFASQTIPIYLGASEVVKFYNPDGIIIMKESDYDRLGDFLKQCTPEEYERRLPAVIDNYNRIMYYRNGNSGLDLVYKQFIRPAIESSNSKG